LERFRKLKSEESSLQKKKQQKSQSNMNSICNNSNESVFLKYDQKNDDINLDSSSINSTNNDFDINTYTLQRMESSVNNSFAVYESINKIINDSFQPQKNKEKSTNFSTINSDDLKESVNTENLNMNEAKTPTVADDEKSPYVIPLNDSPSVAQSKSNTVKKLKKGSKKIYTSDSILFDENKKIVTKDNSLACIEDPPKSSGNTSPVKLKIPESSHDFQFHKFLTPSKCEFCTDIMWGREVKCKCCGIKCHVKCITDKIPECTKKPIDPEIAALYAFGTDLSKQASIEPDNVPFIVKKCTEEVEKRGMDFEGIYRKSGRTLLMKNLISIFSKGEDPDLSEDGEFSEITIITSVLKQYFRELPEAVIPPDTYSKLTELISNDDGEYLNIEEIKKCINTLEASHYSTLKYIVSHLIKVSQLSDVNLMTIKNLAVVFGPTLIGSNEICPEVDFSSTGIKVKIISVILENADTIFT
jgi:hypothetical protein